MQINQPNSFSASNRQISRPIPGLKVAYGSQAQQQSGQYQVPTPPAPGKASSQTLDTGKGLFSRLKEGLFNLVTEEAPSSERPIGISQLSRRTFQATANREAPAFFKSSQPIQDYRFNQLVQPQFHPPHR